MDENTTWSFEPDWTEDQSKAIALELNIDWDVELQQLINTTRQFYHDFDHSPNTRVLIKYLKSQVSQDLNSMTLQLKLSGNPALILSRLAGIPRPKQCF